jgi:hypothetical protein
MDGGGIGGSAQFDHSGGSLSLDHQPPDDPSGFLVPLGER